VQVIIEEEASGPKTGPINLELFLEKTAPDLREVYKDAAEEWRKIGFLSFGKGLSWRINLREERVTVMLSLPQWAISLIQHKDFDKWSKNQALYQDYLASLEACPVAANLLRADKQFLLHDRLTASDLRIVLSAALKLSEGLLKENHASGETAERPPH